VGLLLLGFTALSGLSWRLWRGTFLLLLALRPAGLRALSALAGHQGGASGTDQRSPQS